MSINTIIPFSLSGGGENIRFKVDKNGKSHFTKLTYLDGSIKKIYDENKRPDIAKTLEEFIHDTLPEPNNKPMIQVDEDGIQYISINGKYNWMYKR